MLAVWNEGDVCSASGGGDSAGIMSGYRWGMRGRIEELRVIRRAPGFMRVQLRLRCLVDVAPKCW